MGYIVKRMKATYVTNAARNFREKIIGLDILKHTYSHEGRTIQIRFTQRHTFATNVAEVLSEKNYIRHIKIHRKPVKTVGKRISNYIHSHSIASTSEVNVTPHTTGKLTKVISNSNDSNSNDTEQPELVDNADTLEATLVKHQSSINTYYRHGRILDIFNFVLHHQIKDTERDF